MISGVVLTLAGLLRYRKVKTQLEADQFQPAGFLVDMVGIFVALAGLALAGYLIYIEVRL
jgi:hypothetical protein